MIISDVEEQEDTRIAFQHRRTGSACTNYSLVFERESSWSDESLQGTNDKITEHLSKVSRTSDETKRYLIPEMIQDPTSRPYSSIRYNIYKSKRENEENHHMYQPLLDCKAGKKYFYI
jgi:hypothetical protein